MKPLKRSPHYLVRNPHSYCFRANVPKDLQRLVGRRELRYSLKTGYVGIARVKAQMIVQLGSTGYLVVSGTVDEN